MALQLHRFADRGEYLRSQQLHAVSVGDGLDHHHELVAAEPCHQVALADLRAQALGDFAQQLVPGRMAKGVVDRLETVEVDEKNGQALAAAPRLADCMLERVGHRGAVVQAGQRIVRRHVLNGAQRIEQFRVGPHDARPHHADARPDPRERRQQQCQPGPLIPLDEHIDLVWLEAHQQVDDQRVPGQHEQGGGTEIAGLEAEYAEQHHDQAPGQHQAAVALEVKGDEHDHRDRGQRLRERQGRVGEALVEFQLERGKQCQVHDDDQRDAGEQPTQADQPGGMPKEQQQRANQIGAHANQEATPAFVSVWPAGNFCEEVDGVPLSLFSAGREHFGEQKIFQEHSKRRIEGVSSESMDPAPRDGKRPHVIVAVDPKKVPESEGAGFAFMTRPPPMAAISARSRRSSCRQPP